jgi:hypothetical protein
MRPATESRRIREAARALNVYLGSARNRAMETGGVHHCGVIFHHFGATSAVMNLDQCEDVSGFGGGQTTSVATVSCVGNIATLHFFTDSTLTTTDWPTGLVRPGDLIQLNYQGPLYTVSLPSGTINPVDGNGYVTGGTNTLTATFDNSQGQVVPWTGGTFTVFYRIFRSPTMLKSAATPLQLPASTVIDMGASGPDGGAAFGANDVAILFNSDGSVYGYSIGGAPLLPAVQPIFLLLGKRERVGNTYTAGNNDVNTQSNDQDLTNLWVVINPQTGLVTSGEVGADNSTRFSGSRALARDAQSMGGK